MSENVQTAVFEILMKIQADNADFRKTVELRCDALKTLVRKQRRDVAGMLVS